MFLVREILLFIGQRIIQRLRQTTFRSVLSQEIAFYDKEKSGELITRLSTDTSLIGRAITDNVSDGLRACVQAVGGVSLMVHDGSVLKVLSLYFRVKTLQVRTM